MTIWPKNLFKAKNVTQNLFQAKKLTQKFITSYKIDPKIYFPAKKVPSKSGTSRIPIYGSYPPPPRALYNRKCWYFLGQWLLNYWSKCFEIWYGSITWHVADYFKRTCDSDPAGENSSVFFTVCVKSVPLCHFKLAYVVLHVVAKEFFETDFSKWGIYRFNLESHFWPTLKISCSVLLNSYPTL